MSECCTKGRKRKRSLQDTPVDLGKMRLAMNRLGALKEELNDIEETENEMDAIMAHVAALEEILRGAKKPRITFSAMSKTDLGHLGIGRRRLVLDSSKIAQAVSEMNEPLVEEVQSLRNRILDIYKHVNIDFEPGRRMILDAVLLSIAKVSSHTESLLDVAILPEMRISSGDGVPVVNPISKYEIWLTGNVDYAVIQFKDELDNRERLLGINNSRDDAFDVARGCLFLVTGKHQNQEDNSLASHMPEAVSQAVALGTLTGLSEIRFCLANGQSWIFCVLKRSKVDDEDKWIYYESTSRYLSWEALHHSDIAVREIVYLVSEWLAPTANSQLYQLVD